MYHCTTTAAGHCPGQGRSLANFVRYKNFTQERIGEEDDDAASQNHLHHPKGEKRMDITTTEDRRNNDRARLNLSGDRVEEEGLAPGKPRPIQ